jgi:PEP-CTERM motif
MKVTQLVSFVRSGVACALLVMIAAPASAATIEIGFTGLNLVYDGSALYDAGSTSGGLANPADADALTSVDFSVDGIPAGSLSSDVSADIHIPDVTGIPVGPGVDNQTTPGNPGFFDLLIGTSPLATQFLLVDLEDVNITYLDVANIVQFTFGAAVSDVFAQNLPFALTIGDPITVSFSAQLITGTKTDNGSVITGFSAFGSGEIRGPNVPEPGTCLLAALGMVATLTGRCRK